MPQSNEDGGASVDGFVAPGFEGVREAFARNFAEHGDVGASVCVHLGGEPVVDLWGGVADQATGRPWDRDTIVVVFSTTKGATAACANLLVQRGLLDLDASVTRYWPEFGKEGKEHVVVRWLLAHKAGLPYVDPPVPLEAVLEWDPIVDALAAQAPLWEPGDGHGYHAVTFGWLVGELVRRVSGRSLGRFLADEVAGPLGAEFWIGLPEEEEHRIAPVIPYGLPDSVAENPALRELIEQFVGPESLLGKALSLNGAFADVDVWNRRDVRAAEIGAAGGVSNARGISRLYAGLVGPLTGAVAAPLLTPAQIEAAREVQTTGADRILFFETKIGLGYWVSSPFSPYGAAGSFGHAGAGGAVGFADPENGIGFGYAMNRMQQGLSGDPRTRNLIRAVYRAVGITPVHV